MDRFDFPYHIVTHAYPKGDSFKFGRGYEFSSPDGVVQRRFTLYFESIVWYFADDGTLDATINPQTNALAFDQFYVAHLTHKAFIYPHPVYGDVTVKFAADAPFEMPKSIKGGSGATEAFSVVLVEQPL